LMEERSAETLLFAITIDNSFYQNYVDLLSKKDDKILKNQSVALWTALCFSYMNWGK
jgi:hypothetical protein